jgi:hypothetical protein
MNQIYKGKLKSRRRPFADNSSQQMLSGGGIGKGKKENKCERQIWKEKIEGTGTLNKLKVVWLDRFKLGYGPPIIHYLFNSSFCIPLN